MEINVNELHSRLLSMAKAFHTVCINNNINYYMLGGTMLGAIRHKGFIPWDDDMDFGIPRDDYNRFISLPKEAFPEQFELRYYANTPNSPMHYVKFVDNKTTLIENGYHDYKEGLYIDVFPLDGASCKSLTDKIWIKKILFLQYLIMNHCSTTKRKGLFKRLVKKFCEIQDLNRMHQKLEILMTQRNLSESELIANLLGAWGTKEMMPKEIMGMPKLYPFEDTYFFGSSDYDGYLKSLYGNYMTLPPIDKRIFKHNYYYLDFNKSFKL